MASTGGEIWLQWFACCYQPAAQAQRTRRRIDRSMIGAPTNFQHTGHIGRDGPVFRASPLMHEGVRSNTGRDGPVFRASPLMHEGVRSNTGSTDVDIPSSLLHTMQNQMQSKGGYEMAYGVKVY